METREDLLEAHARLRELMQQVLSTADRVRRGDLEAPLELSALVNDLTTALHRHSHIEDEEAGPLLEALDAWGAERRKSLEARHADEERAAGCLRTATRIEQIIQCVADIVAALGREERELLTESALRPDTVVPNQSDG